MKKCFGCGDSYDESIRDDLCPLCRSLVSKGMPERYLRAAKSTFRSKHKDLIEGNDSLFIHGDSGVGKTWLAAAIMREQMSRTARKVGKSTMYLDDSIFISVPELTLLVRDSMGHGSEDTERKLLNRYGNVKTLILDDIGAENITNYMKTTMHVLIERRNTKLRCRTIITSNWHLGDIDREYGPRVASRITEMCRVVEMEGEDRRVHSSG